MKVLGISGSLRRDSYNTTLLRQPPSSSPEGVELELWDGLKAVPPYDEDDDGDPAPAAVAQLRAAVAGADAILFATPEYNSSIPGSSRTRSTGSRGRWPRTRSATSRSPSSAPRRRIFGAVWAQAELRKVLSTIGARTLPERGLVRAGRRPLRRGRAPGRRGRPRGPGRDDRRPGRGRPRARGGAGGRPFRGVEPAGVRTSGRAGSSRSGVSRDQSGGWLAEACLSASAPRESRRRRGRPARHRTRCSRSRARRTASTDSPPRSDAIREAATTRAAPSANTPAFGTPIVATSPIAYTPGKARLERPRVHRHVAVHGHATRDDDIGGAMLGDAEEEIEGPLGAVVQHGDAAAGVESGDAPA